MENRVEEKNRFPPFQGLYDPQFEHDSCGVGFVCDILGRRSNGIITQGLGVLNRLAHRGAVGSDPKTGDGAGILIQTPHEFFNKVAKALKISLPLPGFYATGLVFLPQDKDERCYCKEVFQTAIKEQGQVLLGWRVVPTDSSSIGEGAKSTQPAFEQVFIARSPKIKSQLEFERKLYVIRRKIENIIGSSGLAQKKSFYITNISSRTFSYKGLLMLG